VKMPPFEGRGRSLEDLECLVPRPAPRPIARIIRTMIAPRARKNVLRLRPKYVRRVGVGIGTSGVAATGGAVALSASVGLSFEIGGGGVAEGFEKTFFTLSERLGLAVGVSQSGTSWVLSIVRRNWLVTFG